MRDGVAKTPEQMRHYLNVALGRVRGLEKLVADLFAYTRMELTEYEPDVADVDLSGLVQTAAAAFADKAAAKGVILKVFLSENGESAPKSKPGAEATMEAKNGTRIAHGKGNGDGNRLKIGPGAQGVRMRSWVVDTGEGIPNDVIRHLTDESPGGPFHYRSGGGLGLGLAIVRRVAALHGGTLTAHNHPDGGAVFALALPIDPPA